ncbi:Fe2+-enterobactin ABC transporter substrate-binding protein [Microtetraspora sp. AC03309]|uniref:Fe2+-enterobactin ABC transporter substrate-binding protein n=1 Tax=Microtetraspora sp. AC03309 TaxID=2779376 RepID=UPI001E4833AA|nr:Fe2+-enterobactin ABC transporter substrate-binding protein [Microtetraspora sp. AC03309]MCC5578410.1 Fe2+-enterobactin ABC transporter substrate-binding protein [Microtetraspora sp. AC03309]
MSFTRRAAAVLAAAIALAGVTACGSGGGETRDEAAAAPASSGAGRSVRHDGGTTEVPAKPQRIVSVSVTLTGHLLAMEAPLIASQATPPSPIVDSNGFFSQWADVAVERGVQVAYKGFEPALEKIAGLRPDLIVGSASGADDASKVYDRLSEIAPTLIYRYDNLSWQDLTTKIGTAIGLEAGAAKVIQGYDQHVSEVKAAIKAPEQEIALLRVNPTEIPVFTPVSAQGQLLTSLGLKVRELPPGLETTADQNEGGARADMVPVATENVTKAFGDASLFFVSHTRKDIDAAAAKPLWRDLPAVKDKRLYDLGLDSFRLDYYSATNVVDRVAGFFKGQ